MGQLEDMKVFIRVVDTGSITKASEQLGIAKSAVSKRLADLEQRLAAKLIHRTTRKSSLTESGSLYYQQAKQILAEIDDLHQQIAVTSLCLQGRLKISLPLSFGLCQLAPLIDEFSQRHPDLLLDVDFSDRKVDVVEDGFDLAFRIDNFEDSSMRARKICTIKHVLCASPKYLKLHGKPQTLPQLKQHKFLKYSSQTDNLIRLADADKQLYNVSIEPVIVANNGDFLKRLALSGHGVTLLPEFIISSELKQQQLLPILTDFHVADMYAYALYPASNYLPLKVRYLIDFLVERLDYH